MHIVVKLTQCLFGYYHDIRINKQGWFMCIIISDDACHELV